MEGGWEEGERRGGGKKKGGGKEKKEGRTEGGVSFSIRVQREERKRRKHSRKKSVRPYTHFFLSRLSFLSRGGEAKPQGTGSHFKTHRSPAAIRAPNGLFWLINRVESI